MESFCCRYSTSGTLTIRAAIENKLSIQSWGGNPCIFVMFSPPQYRIDNTLGRLQTAGAAETTLDQIKQKGVNMEKILAIIGLIIVILCVGLIGNLDSDEYIEVNATAKPKIISN